jgi:bacterioferritin (cytochrome b1)
MISENELWILSFYRVSEISGALFFGRLARSMRPGRIQEDMTKHFADEAMHAWYWTDCIQRLGATPLKLDVAYQDQYLTTAGMPVNIMEILALTQVFERRVMGQYKRHSRVPGMHPLECQTMTRIMRDERWHIKWIRAALQELEPEYGKGHIEATLKRYMQADLAVYRQTIAEHGERVEHLMQSNTRRV